MNCAIKQFMNSYLVMKIDEKQHGPPRPKEYQYTVFDQCHTEISNIDEVRARNQLNFR